MNGINFFESTQQSVQLNANYTEHILKVIGASVARALQCHMSSEGINPKNPSVVFAAVRVEDAVATEQRAAAVSASETARGVDDTLLQLVQDKSLLELKVSEQQEQIEDAMKCAICFENEKQVLFLPCNHVCACESCTRALPAPPLCPTCRAPINNTIRIFI